MDCNEMDDDVNKTILDAEIEAEEDGILDDPLIRLQCIHNF
jgi:hypothetical protein